MTDLPQYPQSIVLSWRDFDFVVERIKPTHQHEARWYPLVLFPFVDQGNRASDLISQCFLA